MTLDEFLAQKQARSSDLDMFRKFHTDPDDPPPFMPANLAQWEIAWDICMMTRDIMQERGLAAEEYRRPLTWREKLRQNADRTARMVTRNRPQEGRILRKKKGQE